MSPSDGGVASRRPTLSSSCARATSADEARFRLRYPRATQASRIIALDEAAAETVCALAPRGWSEEARFLVAEAIVGVEAATPGVAPADVQLRTCAGEESLAGREVDGAELVVMVASSDDGAAAASLIGDLCAQRAVMTTGLVLAEWGALDATLASLRPNAMVMVVSPDLEDLIGILAALRV